MSSFFKCKLNFSGCVSEKWSNININNTYCVNHTSFHENICNGAAVPSICGLWRKSRDLPGSWIPPASHSNWRKPSHMVLIKRPLTGTFL